MTNYRNQLMLMARGRGVLVDEIGQDLFVTAPVLSAPCVRCTDDGLQDIIMRMHAWVDKRHAADRARDAAMHHQLVTLMQAYPKFMHEHAMLMYNPRQRIIKDLRIRERYVPAFHAARQAAMRDSVDKVHSNKSS